MLNKLVFLVACVLDLNVEVIRYIVTINVPPFLFIISEQRMYLFSPQRSQNDKHVINHTHERAFHYRWDPVIKM